MAIQVAERERLLLKEKAELVDIVLNYQHADNSRQQWNELCRTVVFEFNALSSTDETELVKLANSVCHITFDSYVDTKWDNTIVKFHCDNRSDAEQLYDAIEEWALDNNVYCSQSAIEH